MTAHDTDREQDLGAGEHKPVLSKKTGGADAFPFFVDDGEMRGCGGVGGNTT
jgi:hypothetical protein